MTEQDADTLVQNGIRWLNTESPWQSKRWFKKINLTKLNINSLDCCILGQLDHAYPTILRQHTPTLDILNMGFYAPFSLKDPAVDHKTHSTHAINGKLLTAAWKRAVREMRKETAL